MMKRIRIISAALILAIVCFVVATRPERPPVAAVAYDPSDPVQAARATRYLEELDRLGRERDAAQYVLEIHVGEVVTLKTAKGELPLDKNGLKLISRVDVLFPAAPSVGAKLIEMKLLTQAQWIVSTDEDEKAAWAEVLHNSDINLRLDGEIIPWERIEAEVRKAFPNAATFVLMQQGDKVILPEGWSQISEAAPKTTAGMVLVYMSPANPEFELDADVIAVRIGEYATSRFDLVIYKDVATIAARMSVLGLLRKKLIMLPKPPLIIKIERDGVPQMVTNEQTSP